MQDSNAFILLTGQRCQTIHSLDLSGIQSLSDLFRITILHPIETANLGNIFNVGIKSASS